jgi:hypothetical protein
MKTFLLSKKINMRISVSIWVLLFSMMVGAHSQTITRNDSTHSVATFMFNIHAIEPAFNFQYGFANRFSLVAQVGMVGGAFAAISNNQYNLFYYLSPKAVGQIRYYYNFDRRVRNRKVTSRNSANFIGLHTSYIFRPIFKNFSDPYPSKFLTGPVWGLQRTSRSGVNFNFYTGPAISITEKTYYTRRFGTSHYGNLVRFTPVVGISFGGTIFSTAGKRKSQKLIDFAD